MQGTVALALLIGPDGTVRSVRAGGSLRDEALLRCVGDASSQWRFPPPAGGDCAVVSVPFLFAPEGDVPASGQARTGDGG